jgi:hypothetical protein
MGEENPGWKRSLGIECVNGRITSKLTLKGYDMRVWTGLVWFRIGTSGGLL